MPDPTPAIPEAAITSVGRPTLEAQTLPSQVYTDPEIYVRELERLIHREWICVGRVEDVPNVGDYLTTSLGDEPVVVVRDGNGTIRGHLNMCRHRRCAIVKDTGTIKTFRCPYHGWIYALDGTLRGTPAFKETRNFDKADFPLVSVKVELWEGFIMVSLDPDATPFADRVSETTRWGRDKYRLEQMKTTHRWEYELDCNWKTYVENFVESYHVPWVHPETFQLLTPLKKWIEFPDISDQPWSVQVGQTPGLTFSDSGDALFPVSPGLVDLPVEYDGMPVWLVYPSMMVIPSVDALVYYVAFPVSAERTRVMVRVCLPEETAAAFEAGEDEAVMRGAEEYAKNVKLFLAEDNVITQQQQIGLRSTRGEPGRFSKHEGLAREFDQWVAERAYRPDPAGA
jgi:choline monooxygenase